MKPAQAIAHEDSEVIQILRDGAKDKPIAEQLSDLRKEFRSVTRGQDARIRFLEAENHALRNEVLAMKTGVRTTGERRYAEAERVADCGRANDAG
jgi:hypothetical protein